MEPSAHNIQLIIDEWSGRPPYATAHLFCTTALPDSLFDRMKRSPLSSRIRSLKELNIDFIVCILLDRELIVAALYYFFPLLINLSISLIDLL